MEISFNGLARLNFSRTSAAGMMSAGQTFEPAGSVDVTVRCWRLDLKNKNTEPVFRARRQPCPTPQISLSCGASRDDDVCRDDGRHVCLARLAPMTPATEKRRRRQTPESISAFSYLPELFTCDYTGGRLPRPNPAGFGYNVCYPRGPLARPSRAFVPHCGTNSFRLFPNGTSVSMNGGRPQGLPARGRGFGFLEVNSSVYAHGIIDKD